MNRHVTLKDIAQAAKVSVMTVSRVLRNQPNLAAATRERIEKLVVEMGYRPNPMVSALMTSRRRRNLQVTYQPTLAYITNFDERGAWRETQIFKDFFQGAVEGADQQGFKLEEFWLREPSMTPARLSEVLYCRHVQGLLIAPLPVPHGHLEMDWKRFSAVALGYTLADPMLHRAVNHQTHSMRLAMQRAKKYGYRRPGLALPASLDERVDHHWAGSFLGEERRKPLSEQVPLLIVPDKQWNESNFAKWFKQHQPDVIISQCEEILDWLKNLGIPVPQKVGFIHLNCPDAKGSFSGVYQNGTAVGRAAAEYLIGMVLRNECGIPPLPHSILVEGSWLDGATLKKRQ